MYSYSTLPKSVLEFISKTSSTGGNRTEAFTVALGHVLSSRLSLPAEQVESIQEYYRLQHDVVVSESLNYLNEILPFNTKTVKSLIEKFYEYRYQAAHPPKIPLALREGQGLVDFFGLSRLFSESTLCTIDKKGPFVTTYVNNLTDYFAALDARRMANAEKYNEERQVSYVA